MHERHVGVAMNSEDDFEKGKKAYESGNYIQACKYYRLAAKEGHAEAQYELSLMYEEGLGVVPDNKKAVRWLRLAAEQGYVEAQYELGSFYRQGKGVPKNDIRAAEWYSKAAGQGHAEAKEFIATIDYLTELHIKAEQGQAGAQYQLGEAYNLGGGVPPNKQTAYMWFFLAIENGAELEEFVKQDITQLEQSLSHKERAIAKAEAKKIQAKIDNAKKALAKQ